VLAVAKPEKPTDKNRPVRNKMNLNGLPIAGSKGPDN
jgi:hypothetical protein